MLIKCGFTVQLGKCAVGFLHEWTNGTFQCTKGKRIPSTHTHTRNRVRNDQITCVCVSVWECNVDLIHIITMTLLRIHRHNFRVGRDKTKVYDFYWNYNGFWVSSGVSCSFFLLNMSHLKREHRKKFQPGIFSYGLSNEHHHIHC